MFPHIFVSFDFFWTSFVTSVRSVFQEQAGDLDEQISAEFGRLREFLLEEEQRLKETLQKQKAEKLNQLEEALTQATQQISQLENTADKLRLKLREEENPAQLKVSDHFKRRTACFNIN